MRQLFFSRACLYWCLTVLVAMPVQAAKSPNPLATDSRVRQVLYDPNQVYSVTGQYGYQTSIEFAADETVKVVSLGDTIAWQTVPYQNRIFIKPVEQRAETNLTVVTDKRTYYFHLNSAKQPSQLTYLVRFVYPSAQQQLVVTDGKSDVQAAKNMNGDYSASGDRQAIALLNVFDDGQFTYFSFDQNSAVPAVYEVGRDGTESVVNTRREGDYLVVESIGAKFTLRSGSAYLCIRNNKLLPASPSADDAGLYRG